METQTDVNTGIEQGSLTLFANALILNLLDKSLALLNLNLYTSRCILGHLLTNNARKPIKMMTESLSKTNYMQVFNKYL